MQPQGTALVNDAYFAEQQAQAAACAVCAELQTQVNEVMATIQAGKNALTAQLALLTPLVALLTPPGANLGSIVTWITSFITDFLTPYLVPFTNYSLQLTALEAKVAGLVTAFNNAAGNIHGCSITIPPLS